jgi:putative endonuclease
MVTNSEQARGGGKSGQGQNGGGQNTSTRIISTPTTNTQTLGGAAEDRALAYLLARGLVLVQRNYRWAGGPRVSGGEIDLILRDRDGTLVFAEVRARSSNAQGGAAASVGRAKQRHLVRAAQHYLMRLQVLPPCRFDVVAIDGDRIEWLPAAFDAS